MIERITGAAIRLPRGFIYSSPLGMARHSDILHQIRQHEPFSERVGLEMGFVTTRRRFVDLKTARQIAIAARQVDADDTLHNTQLATEDLW